MHPVSCSNTHQDVTDFVNQRMVINTKTWISWEWNITSLRKEKNSCPVPQMTHFEKLSMFYKLMLFGKKLPLTFDCR